MISHGDLIAVAFLFHSYPIFSIINLSNCHFAVFPHPLKQY